MRAWRLKAGRFERGFEPREQWQVQHELIDALAPGKSVIDVGGMWNIYGEIAFRAEGAGATQAVVMDGMDPVDEFQTKHRERNSGVLYVQGDLHDEAIVERLGTFDVVWCSGVVYHSPNPYLQIEHLRRLCAAAGTLMISSRVIPEIPGFEQACLWYPGISEDTRTELRALHTGHGAEGLLGPCAPLDERPGMGYANTFWGITVSALLGMLATARFSVERVIRYSPLMVDVIAHAVEKPSMIPAPAFARERGDARRRDLGEDRPPWLDDVIPAAPGRR